MKKDLLSLAELNSEEVLSIIDLAEKIKKNPLNYAHKMVGKTLLMIFEKPSLRTRVSFEVGMAQMGGHAIYYDVATSPLGKKETIEDTAKTSSRYVDIIMARLFKFDDCKKLAENASIPVIDALSDLNHPCQILGDLLTIREKFGRLRGLTLVYLGDCKNNVTYSLMHGCSLVGMNIRICCPDFEEFRPDSRIVAEAKTMASKNNCILEIIHDPVAAATDADVIYTDSWMSYHIPKEMMEIRKEKLMPFQVTSRLMKYAQPTAVFMNCLPAMRGMEQTEEVIDGFQSIVFNQAENRLHIQKAIILKLLKIE